MSLSSTFRKEARTGRRIQAVGFGKHIEIQNGGISAGMVERNALASAAPRSTLSVAARNNTSGTTL